MKTLKLSDYIRSCLKFRRDRLEAPAACSSATAWALPHGQWDGGVFPPENEDVILFVSWVDPGMDARHILSAVEVRRRARHEMACCIAEAIMANEECAQEELECGTAPSHPFIRDLDAETEELKQWLAKIQK